LVGGLFRNCLSKFTMGILRYEEAGPWAGGVSSH